MDDKPLAMKEDWELLKTFFPRNWESLAAEHQALKGLRKDKSAEQLLRTILIHVGCGYSLRETVVRARMAGLAELSDVALLKRLHKSADWLYHLCRCLFEERSNDLATQVATETMYLLDGTVITEPGKTGSQWRLHYCLRWPSLSCEFFKLTAVKGRETGESLLRFPVVAGAHYLADRGYSVPAGIGYVNDHGGYLAVRLNPDGVRLCRSDGKRFPLLSKLGKITKPGQPAQWPVVIANSAGGIAAQGRLCVVRKSAEATRTAQKKLRRRASKDGTKLRPETLEYAAFVMVFTTFDEDRFPVEAVLEWYRVRWQIELLFKRIKQISGMGHLPKHDSESSKAWLYGKLFVALLTEKIMAYGRSLSPWGYDVQEITHTQ